MSTIHSTINVGADSAGVLASLLHRFPQGRRVRVTFTDDPDHHPIRTPTLEEFSARIDAARRQAPPCPWETTEQALKELREGESD